jgi:hypothetical protein
MAPVIASPRTTTQFHEFKQDVVHKKKPTSERAAVVIPEGPNGEKIHYQLNDEWRHNRNEVQGNVLIAN